MGDACLHRKLIEIPIWKLNGKTQGHKIPFFGLCWELPSVFHLPEFYKMCFFLVTGFARLFPNIGKNLPIASSQTIIKMRVFSHAAPKLVIKFPNYTQTGTFIYVIPKLVIKMGTFFHVIPKLVIKMGTFSHVIPSVVIKMGTYSHVIPNL